MFQLCCLSCNVGKEIAKANGKCAYDNQNSVTGRVINECCGNFQQGSEELIELKGTNTDTDRLTENPSDEEEDDEGDEEDDRRIEDSLCPINHRCEQDCEVRGDRAICLCKEGFELGSNGQSCLAIKSCTSGFEFNETSRHCEGF